MRKDEVRIKSGPKSWGWVILDQLVEILGISAEEILVRFLNLTNTPDVPLMLWSGYIRNPLGQEAGMDGTFPVFVADITNLQTHRVGDYYVPAGWALDVLRAWNTGMRRVIMIPHPEGHKPFKGGLWYTTQSNESGRYFLTAYAVGKDDQIQTYGGGPTYMS